MDSKNKHYSFEDYAKGRAPGDMSYEGYSQDAANGGLSAMAKGDFESAMAKGSYAKGDDSEDEDEEESVEKSIPLDDLAKSIQAYQNIEQAVAPDEVSREDALMAKLSDATISKSERQTYAAELASVLAGEAAPVDALNKSLRSRMGEANPELDDFFDASDIFKSLTQSINDTLSETAEQMREEGEANRTLLKAQGSLLVTTAKVVSAMGERLAKSEQATAEAQARVAELESQPRARRSLQHHSSAVRDRDVVKSGAAAPQPQALTKSQVQHGLNALMVKASDRNDQQAMMELSKATARFESGFGLPDNIAIAVRSQL